MKILLFISSTNFSLDEIINKIIPIIIIGKLVIIDQSKFIKRFINKSIKISIIINKKEIQNKENGSMRNSFFCLNNS